MPSKALVVDANILVRAVLGKHAREVIETHAEDVLFFVPEPAFAEAEEHLSALVVKRGAIPRKRSSFCDLWAVWWNCSRASFSNSPMGQSSGSRLACALALRCPIWTEDTDFFGCGVATWTSDRLRIFLRD